MKIENDNEIIIGKTSNETFVGSQEVPFFVKDIRQIRFNPCEDYQYKYSVLINIVLSDSSYNKVRLFITKEQYKYLQDKLGANDDE